MSRGSSLRGFFIEPQAPGGRIRALGFRAIRRGGRSALPPLRVGSAIQLLVRFKPTRSGGKRDRAPAA
ncbi:hypothetical protein AZE99_13835 [Sphingorhabdus sp. M41]|nr:hypothetical protein AZE99_13835 [Sphingorhabdus sp. M41]